jgi:hypothetical protein
MNLLLSPIVTEIFEPKILMNKQTLQTLLTCAVLGIALTCTVRAQPGPAPTNAAAPGRGGFGRGGFGRGPMLPPGPPAPVPPEVAIARPTAGEVAKMNADLKQFIATSPDKELLQKWESLLTVQLPRDNPCIRPAGGMLSGRHQQFMNIATNSEFDIMFLGDSITDLWNVEADPQGNPGGKCVFDKYFGDVKVANFGISGDTTQGVLWRLQNGEGKGHKPKAVMLMPNVRLAIGSNASSVWWINGQEVVGIYGDRQTVVDDGVSKRLTLKKGPNVVRCAVINGSGATDFCARFLDSTGKPINGLTISLTDTK